VSDLQATVARAADQAGSHSTAPALLLQASAALGRLAELTSAATEGGRRPFRVPPDWQPGLSELAYLVYLLADQTGVDLDSTVRSLADRLGADAAGRHGSANGEHAASRWFAGDS
jgi:hypothetical protein